MNYLDYFYLLRGYQSVTTDAEELKLKKKPPKQPNPKNQNTEFRTLQIMAENLLNLYSLSSKDSASKESHMKAVSY